MSNEVETINSETEAVTEDKNTVIAAAVKRKIKDVLDNESKEVYEHFSSFANEREDWIHLQTLQEPVEEDNKKLINQWFEEEGFDVNQDELEIKESYRFKAKMHNEKFQRDYLIEVKDHGSAIKKVKWLIL